jgi:hypothetical protein
MYTKKKQILIDEIEAFILDHDKAENNPLLIEGGIQEIQDVVKTLE